MKKLFLRAEFGPLWGPWEVDETPRKMFLTRSVSTCTISATILAQDVGFFSYIVTASHKSRIRLHYSTEQEVTNNLPYHPEKLQCS